MDQSRRYSAMYEATLTIHLPVQPFLGVIIESKNDNKLV